MTVESIRAKMRQIYDDYYAQIRNYTSVQRPSFEKQFGIKHGVNFIHGNISLVKPVSLDEVCTVIDVIQSYEFVDSFWSGSKKVECYEVICDNNFRFSARFYSGAESLNRGQKIRITGEVGATISSYDGDISVSITGKPFKTKFSTV